MQPDLFGTPLTEPTFADEYAEYIRSPQWRRKAAAALARADYRCERCGLSRYSRRLEVHHITYERFKQERPEDLEVLCPQCHEQADAERAAAAAETAHERQSYGPLARGFEEFMRRGTRRYDWQRGLTRAEIRHSWSCFLDEIYRERGVHYYAECPFLD